MNPINTLCGQNAELQIVKACGTYNYHKAFKGLISKEQKNYLMRNFVIVILPNDRGYHVLKHVLLATPINVFI
jgi:hypothetical protein